MHNYIYTNINKSHISGVLSISETKTKTANHTAKPSTRNFVYSQSHLELIRPGQNAHLSGFSGMNEACDPCTDHGS